MTVAMMLQNTKHIMPKLIFVLRRTPAQPELAQEQHQAAHYTIACWKSERVAHGAP